jgi:hypothetical protein
MEGDQFSALDVALVCALCLLLWILDFLLKRRKRGSFKLEYHIYPVGGRRFHWRRLKVAKEQDESLNN